MKHTPAPWIIDDEYITTEKRLRDGIVEICAVDIGFDEPFETEQKANAKLISAAPELLDALQSLLDMYVDFINSGDAGNWNPEEEKEVIKARAAISKATGA